MKLIVGLGNPGTKYQGTRHNVWFMALERFAEANGFSDFVYENKFSGELSVGQINGEKILLFKPMLFMNKSGQPVQQIVNFYKISLDDVLVLHDEIDLDFGVLKLKIGGGHAGHNGLRDIISFCGSDFARVRIGVGRPTLKDEVSDYVLSNFSTDQTKSFEELWVSVFELVDAWFGK